MRKTAIYFNLLKDKIRSVKSIMDLKKIETSCDRLYNAGLLTVSEYKRLCVLSLEQYALIEGN